MIFIERVGRTLLMAILIGVLTGSLGACGRKGTLKAPEDVDPAYPRAYPALEKIPGKKK